MSRKPAIAMSGFLRFSLFVGIALCSWRTPMPAKLTDRYMPSPAEADSHKIYPSISRGKIMKEGKSGRSASPKRKPAGNRRKGGHLKNAYLGIGPERENEEAENTPPEKRTII